MKLSEFINLVRKCNHVYIGVPCNNDVSYVRAVKCDVIRMANEIRASEYVAVDDDNNLFIN